MFPLLLRPSLPRVSWGICYCLANELLKGVMWLISTSHQTPWQVPSMINGLHGGPHVSAPLMLMVLTTKLSRPNNTDLLSIKSINFFSDGKVFMVIRPFVTRSFWWPVVMWPWHRSGLVPKNLVPMGRVTRGRGLVPIRRVTTGWTSNGHGTWIRSIKKIYRVPKKIYRVPKKVGL